MTSAQSLSVLAGVVNFVATVLYVLSIWRGKTIPSRITWIIWTLLSLLTAGGMYQSDTLNGQMYAVVTGDIIITFFAMLWGSGGWTVVDRRSLAGALIGLTVWVLTKDPFYAILISLSVNYIGAVPTIAKTWQHPEEEDLVAWATVTLATFIQFLAVTEWTFAAMAQPISYLTIQAPLVLLICLKFLRGSSGRTIPLGKLIGSILMRD